MTKRKPGAVMGAPATAQAKLTEYGLDAMCEAITDGSSIKDIVDKIGVSRMAWSRWVGDPTQPERKAAIDAARIAAAGAEDDMALGVLERLPDDPSPGQVAKAREIANHRRWRSARLDPATYGEKRQIDLTTNVRDLDTDALNAEIEALTSADTPAD